MLRITLRSAGFHRGALLATGIVSMVGTMLVAAMAGLLATGLRSDVAQADRPFLTQFPVILGSWVVGIVVFAVLSSVGVTLDGRVDEITGLRLTGATPKQVRSMIAVESASVGLVAAVPGVAASYLVGWLIVHRTRSAGVISDTTNFAPGLALPVLAGVIMVLATGFGGYAGSRAVAERSPVGAPDPGRRRADGRGRRIAGAVFIGVGLGSSATALATDPATVYGTAATGPGCVLVAVGLALLARELLGLANLMVRVVPVGKRSAAGHLARINLRVAPDRIRPVVTFLTLFVGVAAGTLSMQSIENAVSRTAGTSGSAAIGQLMASINYLVVALIAAFMAIALTNNLISSIRRRGKEFAAMSSVGATAGQIRRMLTWELTVAVLVSVLAGCAGAVVSVIPFAVLKTGGAGAAFAPVPYLAVVLVGALGSFLIARCAARGPAAGAATAAATIA